MSGLLAGKVWQSGLDGTLKPLGACLADIANDDGSRIYPSNEYLCWLTGKSIRAVRYGLNALLECGVLETVGDTVGGHGRFIEYRMIEEKLPKRKTWKEIKKGANSAPFSWREKGAKNGRNGANSVQKDAILDASPIEPIIPAIDTRKDIERPRRPGSSDEHDDKAERYSIAEMENLPAELINGIRLAMAAKFPSVPFDKFYRKWWRSRDGRGGIGRRRGEKATIRQYTVNIEGYFETVSEGGINSSNGNGKTNYSSQPSAGAAKGVGSQIDTSLTGRIKRAF